MPASAFGTRKRFTGGILLLPVLILLAFQGRNLLAGSKNSHPADTDVPEAYLDSLSNAGPDVKNKLVKTDSALRIELPASRFQITQCGGTEPPFRNAFWNNHATGLYVCAVCGNHLFHSSRKFDSGTGWPSFWSSLGSEKVTLVRDSGHGMVRTEVKCARCNSHLGHLFEDGPAPTGMRYCMNSGALLFKPLPK